jgi:hypothetical protein
MVSAMRYTFGYSDPLTSSHFFVKYLEEEDAGCETLLFPVAAKGERMS